MVEHAEERPRRRLRQVEDVGIGGTRGVGEGLAAEPGDAVTEGQIEQQGSSRRR